MSQRKNYFIEKGMQSKFILTLLLLLFLVAVITICNLYVIVEYVLKSQGPEYEDSARSFVAIFREGVLYRLILIGLVNVIIVAIIGVFYSHQFAGPSYKLEKSIRQIASGDLSFLVTLRKSDSMHNIAESLNVMVAKYKEVFVKAHELTGNIKKTLEALKDQESAQKDLAVLRGTTAELDDLLAGFKFKNEERVSPDAAAEAPAPPASQPSQPSA